MIPERLRALLAEATPGPWMGCGDYIEAGSITHRGQDTIIATFEPDTEGRADATLIAAAVNALPALLDVAEAAQAWRDKPYATNADPEWLAVCAALDRLDRAR